MATEGMRGGQILNKCIARSKSLLVTERPKYNAVFQKPSNYVSVCSRAARGKKFTPLYIFACSRRRAGGDP